MNVKEFQDAGDDSGAVRHDDGHGRLAGHPVAAALICASCARLLGDRVGSRLGRSAITAVKWPRTAISSSRGREGGRVASFPGR